jgi:hypothetical protein
VETNVGDLLLIYNERTPLGFARVEDISSDVKAGWWRITLMLLHMPIQYVTWILREEYIDGEVFSIESRRMRLQRLPSAGVALTESGILEPVIRSEGEEKDAPGQPAMLKENQALPDNVVSLRARKSKSPSGDKHNK